MAPFFNSWAAYLTPPVVEAGREAIPVYDGFPAYLIVDRSLTMQDIRFSPKEGDFMQRLSYSDAGFDLTKRFEGLRLQAYEDQGGVWTIGYGHTGAEVRAGQEVTPTEAEGLLRVDLQTAVDSVNDLVKLPVGQQRFDALVDFCFNAGRGNFARSSLLKQVNARCYTQAADQFLLWVHVNGVPNRGLVRRRNAERAMFLGEYRENSIP